MTEEDIEDSDKDEEDRRIWRNEEINTNLKEDQAAARANIPLFKDSNSYNNGSEKLDASNEGLAENIDVRRNVPNENRLLQLSATHSLGWEPHKDPTLCEANSRKHRW